MIHEWQPNARIHNFGDHLILLLGEKIYTKPSWRAVETDKKHAFILLGSCIHDYTISKLISEGLSPVMIGCGYRGEALSSAIVRMGQFFGCRGFNTHNALTNHGIRVSVVGDPAMILPLVLPKRHKQCGAKLFMPHVNDGLRTCYDASDVGCDFIIQPETHNLIDVEELITRISSARFVLAGAMHAAIVAHAYGVPFAFYAKPGGYIDCPPKWDDWLTSISAPFVKAEFFSNAEDGLRWYVENRTAFYRNPYLPILSAYSNIGKIKRYVLIRAMLHDTIKAAWIKLLHCAYFKK